MFLSLGNRDSEFLDLGNRDQHFSRKFQHFLGKVTISQKFSFTFRKPGMPILKPGKPGWVPPLPPVSIVSRDILDFDDVECGMWTGIPTTKVTFLVQIKSILFTSNQVNLKL